MLFKGQKKSFGRKKIREISQHILSWLKKHEFQQRIDKVKKEKSHQNDFPFQKKGEKKEKNHVKSFIEHFITVKEANKFQNESYQSQKTKKVQKNSLEKKTNFENFLKTFILSAT